MKFSLVCLFLKKTNKDPSGSCSPTSLIQFDYNPAVQRSLFSRRGRYNNRQVINLFSK